MVEPIVVARSEHSLSRRAIDPDALKVLYRLHERGFAAYLVGGSVRDLLLGRRPKDFDIGTSAHPSEVKRLFRNCWIIGRRFRLAHVKFGTKVIEVATFRRKLTPGTELEPPLHAGDAEAGVEAGPEIIDEIEIDESIGNRIDPEAPPAAPRPGPPDRHDRYKHENTFGTPEEDAFRRDFTINALFYDIGTFAIIDYVGGLEDLKAGRLRSIGDPNERFLEDPVRMLRAVALSARLNFLIDAEALAAIATHGGAIAHASAARLLDEYYKILRSGAAERTFRGLADLGLLDYISPELARAPAQVSRALAAIDEYRQRFEAVPETLTNVILLGSMLVPTGFSERRVHSEDAEPRRAGLGALPIARRDLERLQQILVLQRRLLDLGAPPRAQQSLLHRSSFREALTWLEIHGKQPDVVSHWLDLADEGAESGTAPVRDLPRRRRRRRRGRSPNRAAE